MRTSRKTKSMMLMLAATSFCTAFGFATYLASANEQTIEANYAVKAAAVRQQVENVEGEEVTSVSGIKFALGINEAYINNIVDNKVADVTIGALIIPAGVLDYYKETELTINSQTANNSVLFKTDANGAVVGLNEFETMEGTSEAQASVYLMNQTSKHYDKEIIVRGYITDSTGTVYTEPLTCSMSEIAYETQKLYSPSNSIYTALGAYYEGFTYNVSYYDSYGELVETQVQGFGDAYQAPENFGGNVVVSGWKCAVGTDENGEYIYSEDNFDFTNKMVKSNMVFKAVSSEITGVTAEYDTTKTFYKTSSANIAKSQIKDNLTVNLTFSDGTTRATNEYELSGDFHLVGTNNITVTYGDFTDEFDLPVSDTEGFYDYGEIADFNDGVLPFYASEGGGYASSGYNLIPAEAGGNGAYAMNVRIAGDKDVVFEVNSGTNLSNITTISYWVYYKTAEGAPGGHNATNIARPAQGEWTLTIYHRNGELYSTAWNDGWYRVVATTTTPVFTDTISFVFPNAGGYVQDAYLDQMYAEMPHRENEIACFEDASQLAGYSDGGLTSAMKYGAEGSSVQMHFGPTRTYWILTIKSQMPLDGLTTIYASLYVDSTSFKDASGNSASPSINANKIANILPYVNVNGSNQQFTCGNIMAWEFDTWLSIMLKLPAGQTFSGNSITLTFYSNNSRWGLGSNTSAIGYSFDMYIDEIVTDGTLFNEVDKVDNGATTTYKANLDPNVVFSAFSSNVNGLFYSDGKPMAAGQKNPVRWKVLANTSANPFMKWNGNNFGIAGFAWSNVESLSFWVNNGGTADFTFYFEGLSSNTTTVAPNTWTKVTLTKDMLSQMTVTDNAIKLITDYTSKQYFVSFGEIEIVMANV